MIDGSIIPLALTAAAVCAAAWCAGFSSGLYAAERVRQSEEAGQ